MSKGNDEQKLYNMAHVGNFTRNAVASFEENIIKRKDYLEEVDSKKTQ